MKKEIKEIPYQMAKDFLLPRHYSGVVPSISVAYGWFINDTLEAVITYGKPASNSLCKGVCGSEYSDCVYELNRLCRTENIKGLQLSEFVSGTLRELKKRNWIIISYADTGMYHTGYVYQACNFIYTGTTKPRTDVYSGAQKHSRHYTKEQLESNVRKYRTAKHRYIYFCTSDKKLKKKWKQCLKYPVYDRYPKSDNREYELGEVIEPILVERGNKLEKNLHYNLTKR